MEIPDIKDQLSIQDVLHHYQIKPDKNNRALCPFHNDKTPSLQIYPKTNTYCCFSTNCVAGTGDVIQFIELKEGCTKHEAIMKAKELLGCHPSTNPNTEIPALSVHTEHGRSEVEVLTKLFSTFRSGIKQCKPALEYLEQRSLELSSEIGYNGGRFYQYDRISEEELRTCLQLGLLKPYYQKKDKQMYRAWAKDCIIFPLKDKQGKIVSFYGRSLKNEGNSKHFYLPNRKGLYPNYPKPNTTKLILTESIIDAETLLQVPEVTKEHEALALYGTNGLTEEHKRAIAGLGELEEVILFFDGDQAGVKAVEKYTKELQLRQGLVISAVKTPDGEDVNSLLQGHDAEIFTHLLAKRQTLITVERPILLSTENPSVEKKNGTEVPPPTGTLDTGNPERITYETTELLITIWGGIELDNLARLRVSLHVQSKTDRHRTFRDDVNLYSHSSALKAIRNMAEILELPTTTIGRGLTELTEQLEQYRMEQRTQRLQRTQPKPYEMTSEEKQAAMKLLKSNTLARDTMRLIAKGGLVGEQNNGLLLYFLYLSRLTDEPLHAIIFGQSGSGKTWLQQKVSACLPEEAVRMITSLTENTLYYSPKDHWKHKVLLIEDLDGVYNAFLSLREFMSNQRITRLTTDKDVRGNNVQKELTVEGPICVSGATTKMHIYEDNANRSFLLHVDESSTHLGEVMHYQRKEEAGMIDDIAQQQARTLLQNAQRLIANIHVVNPYSMELDLPEHVFKKLRTNKHYLRLVRIVTLYHQHQREIKVSKSGKRYIETTLEDIEVANELVKDNMLRKSDELNGELRGFFERLKSTVKKGESFYARQIREAFRMNPMKVNRCLRQLESMGYVQQAGGNRKTGYEYQIKTYEEYERLKNSINVLDDILERLKEKERKKKDGN